MGELTLTEQEQGRLHVMNLVLEGRMGVESAIVDGPRLRIKGTVVTDLNYADRFHAVLRSEQ